MKKLTSKLNKRLYSLRPHRWANYMVLASFCFNLTLTSLPMAAAEDRNVYDYSLIALADNQNPNYSETQNEETLYNNENMFVESICTPGIDCPEDLMVKIPSVQSNYKNTQIRPLTPSLIGKTLTNVVATAYSSTPDQTDASPFITANGTFVRDGIVACNFLPFGAKIRFPEYSGDKIYIVADRMAKKNNDKIDLWMESRSLALQFGVKRLTVEILE